MVRDNAPLRRVPHTRSVASPAMRIAALAACLLGIALLPAAAHASQLVIGVYAQGPGTVTGSGLATPCVSTAPTGTKKLCGLTFVGYTGESSSSVAGYSPVAKATQPDKSTFLGWDCTVPSPMDCGDCTTAGCTLFSPLTPDKYPVTLVAKFADTFPASAPTVTPTYSTTVDGRVSFGVTA